MADESSVSRRDVLEATGGTIAAVSASGLASADPDTTVEVNVGFDGPAARSATIDAADEVVREFDFGAATIRTAKAAADRLGQRPDVRYVERNGTKYVHAQTLPWGIDRTDADVAHNNDSGQDGDGQGETGQGVDIAIIDTGIDSDHPDLQANLGSGRAFVGCRGSPNQCVEPWDDDFDHGTHVAGIADAVDNTEGVVGVSTDATLHALKVCDKSGSCGESAIASAIEHAANQGYDVANLSLGGGGHSNLIDDAGQFAASQGVTLVASAGNAGPCTNCVSFPAANEEFIAVSASNCSDGLASFSSQGPRVDLIAPGADVFSSVIGGYGTFSGTSMSAPHVTGAAAQLAANGFSRSEIESKLKNNAEDIGLSSNEQGAGLLDVAASLGLSSTDDGFGNGPNC